MIYGEDPGFRIIHNYVIISINVSLYTGNSEIGEKVDVDVGVMTCVRGHFKYIKSSQILYVYNLINERKFSLR